jgi:hypothetical protein
MKFRVPEIVGILSNKSATVRFSRRAVLYGVSSFARGFQSGENLRRSLLGYDAVWCCGRIPTFERHPTITLHGVTTQKT